LIETLHILNCWQFF